MKDFFIITDQEEKRLKDKFMYLIAVYLLCFCTGLFYLIRFNFIYHETQFNFLLIPFFILMSFVVPLIYWKTKKVFLSGLFFYLGIILQATIFIYISGGIRAPGAFWISMIPLLGGVSFGRKGIAIGLFLTIVVLIVFFYAEALGGIPNRFDSNFPLYMLEKEINLSMYTLVSVVITFYYITTQENYADKLTKEKSDNENLLRVLFHDLANPIQILKVQVKKMKRLTEKNDIENEIVRIESTIQKMVEHLEQVKKLKSYSDGKKSLQLESVSLNEAFLKVEEMLHYAIEKKGVFLAINTQMHADLMVEADRLALIYQVFGNLISNAIKFSFVGDVIEVNWQELGDKVVVEIIDTGQGMPKEIVENLFSDKFSTSRSGTNGEIGTGYGMPIVKNFIDLFHAKIEVQSSEKKNGSIIHGTTITLTFPKMAAG